MNERIHFSPVRLVDQNGEQIGVVPVEEALARAREAGLDLVEVSPDARPIVCRIMDWGKQKYLKQKKDRKARQREHTIEIKQIKYRPAIDGHDFETKTNKVRKFLSQGHKVKITIMFRSRDIRRPENGYKVLERVAESVAEVGFTETKPGNIENRNLTMVLAPLKKDPPPRKARTQNENADSSESSPASSPS
jgi:translation initiation factor IF-3